MQKKGDADREYHKNTYAIVGELVLISNALDSLLNRVLIAVLSLEASPTLEPVVATLDPARKIEILKARAGHIANDDWKKRTLRFVKQAESVFKQRNIVCHTPAVLDQGQWKLKPLAAAKMFKNLDLSTKSLRHLPINDLKHTISAAEVALAAGVNLIENFQRANVELKKRNARR